MDLDNRWRNIALILLVLTLFLPLVYAFTGTGSIYEVNSTAQGASGDTGIGSTYTIRYTTTPYQPGSFPAQNDDLTANIGWFTGAIGNTEPNITRIYITTPSGRNLTTEAITCYVNVSDTQEENLTVYFNWYNNSVQIPSLSGAANARNGILTNISTLQSTLTTTGENWTCEAKASDGRINETDWNNATIVITAITTPGGAAGGAAGGGVIRTEIPQPCIEAWICTEWSN
ncbi:hypothetical protein JW851_04970, partial [Candidatus Woesearchaeota archaeon]|nr:hypothetical protein [Candidatus Woesearchaeota archaeon]